MKNSLSILLGLMFATLAIDCSAALPPKYLEVRDFRLCLATQKISSYRAWCMPDAKPARCPTSSWQQLNALRGIDKLPDCTSDSNPTMHSPADKPTDN